MSIRGIRRGTAMVLASAALTGGIALAGAGSASAASGGGCGGPEYKQSCISATSEGYVNSDAYTTFSDANCSVDVVMVDKTTNFRWDKWFPCGTPNVKTRYQGNLLSNPARGHVYQTELRVYWNGNADVTYGPELTF
ncbi:hypothetical protein [Streptomyces sp. NPDC001678]|uniref:hypothetical protein n=1 Tax=Streptomyces sp. NPDC001678 TaxID=3364599 RepID=UPI003678D4D1